MKPFYGNRALTCIHTYGDLLAAERAPLAPKLLAVLSRKKESIKCIRESQVDNLVRMYFDGKDYPFRSKHTRIGSDSQSGCKVYRSEKKLRGVNDSLEIFRNPYKKSEISYVYKSEIPVKNEKSCMLNVEVVYPSKNHTLIYFDQESGIIYCDTKSVETVF